MRRSGSGSVVSSFRRKNIKLQNNKSSAGQKSRLRTRCQEDDDDDGFNYCCVRLSFGSGQVKQEQSGAERSAKLAAAAVETAEADVGWEHVCPSPRQPERALTPSVHTPPPLLPH